MLYGLTLLSPPPPLTVGLATSTKLILKPLLAQIQTTAPLDVEFKLRLTLALTPPNPP